MNIFEIDDDGTLVLIASGDAQDVLARVIEQAAKKLRDDTGAQAAMAEHLQVGEYDAQDLIDIADRMIRDVLDEISLK